jgi:hypothetical protein
MDKLESSIAQSLRECVTHTVRRISARKDKKEENYNPFQEAILPLEARFWSRFERSFSTSFGQKTIESLSATLALASGATSVERQKKTKVRLAHQEYSLVDEHISLLKNNALGRKPSWELDMNGVKVGTPRRNDERLIITDLYFIRESTPVFVTIKTVKPNIDQLMQAKREMMLLSLNDSNAKVYIGLYYNPFGNDRASYDWSPAKSVFDILYDPVFLVGKQYWETVGFLGCYELLLNIADKVGKEMSDELKAMASKFL